MSPRFVDLQDPAKQATDIFKREMDDAYKNTKVFLQNLLNNIEITHTKVGRTFNYPHGIIEKGIYQEYENFMKYFIRKHLSNQYRMELNDIAVEMILKEPKIYFRNHDLIPRMSKHYLTYKSRQMNAMGILKSIKIVSQACSATYNEYFKIKRIINIDSDEKMLLEVIKYFENLPFKNVQLTPNLDCEYFNALPDFIFDNGQEQVLYEIKTSKYVTLVECDAKFSPANFYKLIAYAYCYYKKTGRIIKTFRIYNPLLGCEHQIVIKDIDFNEFERWLETDLYGMPKLKAMDIK